MTPAHIAIVYGSGALIALLSLIAYNRKDLADGYWGDEGGIAAALIFGTWLWPLMAAGFAIFGFFWLLANGAQFVAKGMIGVERFGERRREQRALAEKAQQEIFADIDAMLKEGRDTEIRAFMAQLKGVAA